MTDSRFKLIDGIKCFAPELLHANEDYPYEVFEKVDQIEQNHYWYTGRKKSIYNMLRNVAQSLQPINYLEIGGGTGATAAYLSSKFPGDYVVSEVSLQALLNARKKYPSNQYMQISAMKIPFESQYNLIGIFDVIEHLQDDKEVINQIYKSLIPNGYVIISVPQYPWLWSEHDDLSGHKRRYTKKSLSDLLIESNFEVIRITSYMFLAFPLMLLSRLRRSSKKPNYESAISEVSGIEVPKIVNLILKFLTTLDAVLVRIGFNLPFGGSLIVLGRKKS